MVAGDLAGIAERAEAAGLASPALIVVGGIVALRGLLNPREAVSA
jgi:siroheme synthase